MNRKNFIYQAGQWLGAAIFGGSVLTSCRKKEVSIHVHPQKAYRWKMVTTWPKNFPGLGTGAEKLAKWIGVLSDGRLQVKLYAAGELVPPFEVFQAVASETAEMGHGAAYYWKGNVPEAQFFAAVPFGLNAGEMSGWIHHGGGEELWESLYADFGLKPFPCGNTGVQMGGWFHRPIRSFSDFKGMKIRMPGLGGEVLRRAGATVVSLPGGEIFQALHSGAIDATEWVGPYNDLAFGLYKAAKYYHWPGWHEPGTVLELIVNKKQYDKLPKDLQVILYHACKAAYADMLAEFTARNNQALQQLVNKQKVQLVRFPQEVLREAGKLSAQVVAEVGDQSAVARKIHKSYQAFRSHSVLWNHMGEEAFSSARMLSEPNEKIPRQMRLF